MRIWYYCQIIQIWTKNKGPAEKKQILLMQLLKQMLFKNQCCNFLKPRVIRSTSGDILGVFRTYHAKQSYLIIRVWWYAYDKFYWCIYTERRFMFWNANILMFFLNIFLDERFFKFIYGFMLPLCFSLILLVVFFLNLALFYHPSPPDSPSNSMFL